MGNILSASPDRNKITNQDDLSESEIMEDINDLRKDEKVDSEQFHDTIDNDEDARAIRRQEKLNEFKKQLDEKREQRKEILARHRAEKKNLEDALQAERQSKIELCESNKMLRKILEENNIEIPNSLQSNVENLSFARYIYQMNEEVEKLKANNHELRINLATSNRSLQDAYSDIADLSVQNTESMKQINALKEVITVSKTMINLREDQLNELKQKLNEIEQSLADRETNMLSTDLRQEYERQLQNIRTLRGLYEERARLAEVTKQALVRELDEHKVLLQAEITKNTDLNKKVEELENKVNKLEDTIDDKNHLISSVKEETRGLKSEMAVVNKLFSQVLLGYQSKNYLDTLVHRLEENHGLLTHMAEQENGSEVSTALPKLLLEIIDENDKKDLFKSPDEQPLEGERNVSVTEKQMPSKAEEIVQNLPKVWRVLMELLSHQAEPETSNEKVTTCYKSVNTKSGPVLVPSVSQTYIRLKDLILEKLALIKEVNRMKQLNTHLETRLGEQEKRLCLVTNELTKTWHVVGRLRRHHHQLHTHEKILKYELQQKRKLLNELKEELEYCREKCDQAREKNSQSERDWRILRAEFSNRKLKLNAASLNNSAESGYSDERASDESSESNDESEYVTEPRIKCKKKIKKVFEAVIDSSADLNLVAEREDPASDMLDVAELPLDNQDDNPDILDISTSCNSENLLKSDNIVETEDECADIGNDSCVEDMSTTESSFNAEKSGKLINKIEPKTTQSNEINEVSISALINPAEILKNIQKQNERLALKDRRLESLEKDSNALFKKTQAITTLGKTIDNTLNVILNRPTTSKEVTQNNNECPEKGNQYDEQIDANVTSNTKHNIFFITHDDKLDQNQIVNVSLPTSIENNEHLEKFNSLAEKYEDVAKNVESKTNSGNNCKENPIILIDPATILKNIQKQKERLDLKDNKLVSLEKDSSDLLKKTHEIATRSNVIDLSLDNILNRPTTSKESLQQDEVEFIKENKENSLSNLQDVQDTNKLEIDKCVNVSDSIHVIKDDTFNSDLNKESCSKETSDFDLNIEEDKIQTIIEPSTSGDIDHEARFAARDLRLQRLEEQTKSLVNKVNKTKTKGVKIHYKLEELHNIYGSENSRSGTPSEDTEETSQNTDED